MTEEWRPVVGHPGYEISDRGRIRSLDRTVPTTRGSRTYPGRTLRPSRDRRTGYLQVKLVRHGRAGRPRRVAA